MSRRILSPFLALALLGCASDAAFAPPALTFDPCGARVAVEGEASPAQLASLDAALDLWNEAAHLDLRRADGDDPAAIPLRFADAAPLFRGLYDDEQGIIYINVSLTDPRERTITIAHELGHAFGLPHVAEDERASVMNLGNVTVEPTPEDVAEVDEIWGGCAR
jgi:hypothetical protein